MRVFLVTLLGAVLLAGCGGSEMGSSTDSAATAPSNVGFYVSVDTNRDGDQWRKLEALVDEIPGGQEALDSFLGAFAKDAGVDIDEDVLPAVGGEVVLVLPAGSANPVVLVQPEDREKLEQLTAKSDEDLVLREVEGWTAIGETEAALDTYEQALEAGRLADDAAFSEAMADLPAEALVHAYVRGEGLEGVLGRAQAGALGSLGALGGLGGLAQGGSASAAALGTIALAVAAEDGGVRISGSADQEGIPPSFAPKLLPKVPHGAFVAVTFKGGKALSEQLRKTVAGSEAELRQLEQLLGITLDDLLELFEGEAVFYARPGLPIPELTLAVESTGGQLKTIDALFQRLAAQSNAKITSSVESGVPVKILAVQGISVRYAETAGLVVVTTSPAGIRALAAGGAKLVDDNGFKAAARDVGYDGSTTGFVYVDVEALAPLLQGFLGLAGGGGTPGAAAGLEQLARAIEAFDSVAANVTSRGNRAQFEAFVRIR